MAITKQRLLCIAVFAAMTTACSTGGGLDNGNGGVSTIPTPGKGTPNGGSKDNDKSKTKYVKVNDSSITALNNATEEGNNEPAPQVEYGYSIASPFTGGPTLDGMTTEQKQTNASINKAAADSDANADDYDTLTFVNSPEKQSDGSTKQVTITKDGFTDNVFSVSDTETYYPVSGDTHADIKDNLVLVIDGNNYDALKMVAFNHTKAGAVFEAGGNQYANIFYRGKDASELLPSGGTAQYNGAWTVVRKVEVNPGEAVVGYGPDSLNTRTPADFTVDFSNKSIRGNLNKNLANDQAFAYTLNGKINGNTFTADATSTDAATNPDTAKVTGGFFGDQGAELAGKLLSDNAAGVFAAKQTGSENITAGEAKPKTIYNQAKAINFTESGKPVFTTNFEDVMENTQKLPKLDEITLNGVKINLLTEAAKENSNIFTSNETLPLQFTHIGSVQTDANNPTYTYFYQGQLTQTMPTTGTANYEGNWIGYGQAENGTPYSISKASDARINFNADFASKALSGKFLTPAGNDAMTLSGVKISGNTFTGQANIVNAGLTNDKDGSQSRIKGTVNVSGGFFGDKANELGGQFTKEDKNFAGVFAGKQTTK